MGNKKADSCFGKYSPQKVSICTINRTITSHPGDRELLPASRINSSLTELIRNYEHQTEIERNQILDFHVRFEEIFPFEDGNGRVGRLIMFKEYSNGTLLGNWVV